jgi:hypothetical protein
MTNEQQASPLGKFGNPIVQATITMAAVVLVNVVAKLFAFAGANIEVRFPWLTAAAFMLVFALFNSIISLSSSSMLKYWSRSVYSFLGLGFASAMLAYLLSGLSLGEAGSYWWIFIVVAFGYLVFLSMMAMIRNIVEFAQKEEWNQPRFRQKKRK